MPRSRRTLIEGERDGALLVRLSAPPVDDAANEQLIGILAQALGVARRQLRIASGERGRRKRILVRGMTAADVRNRIASGGQGRGDA